MNRNRKVQTGTWSHAAVLASSLTALAAIVAGCATSNFKLATQQRTSLQPVSDDRVANAPLETAPKILPETHLAAGKMFEAQRDVPQAIQQYRKAIAVNHRNLAAHQRLGYLLGQVGEHAEAIDVLGRALSLEPGNAVLRNNLGFELMHVQRWGDAEAELRTAIRQKPAFTRAHVNLAMVLSQTGRFDEALEEFRSALPETDAHYNMGLLYRGQQRYEEARTSFEHVLALNPAFTAARAQLAEIAPHLAPSAVAVARSGQAVVGKPEVEGSNAAMDVDAGFTVSRRASHAAGTAPDDATGIGTPVVIVADGVNPVENRVDLDDDGEAPVDGEDSIVADPSDSGSDSTAARSAASPSDVEDWTIPFGLSMARRLSEVRAEGDTIPTIAERNEGVTVEPAASEPDDKPTEIDAQRPGSTTDRLTDVARERDPWTQGWIEDLQALDSRLTVVRNQIACLDEQIARHQREAMAAEREELAARSVEEESDGTSVIVDEAGVYARVLGTGGVFGIDPSDGETDTGRRIVEFSPAEPLASEGVYGSTPDAYETTNEGREMERRNPVMPVKYEERVQPGPRNDPKNQGAFHREPSMDDAVAALSLVRNEIRCLETTGNAAKGSDVSDPWDDMGSWAAIASWPGPVVEPSWCDPMEFVPMCDPRWDDDDAGPVKSSQTSMNSVRPMDPRRVRPPAD